MFMPVKHLSLRGRVLQEAPGWHVRIYMLIDGMGEEGTIRYIGQTRQSLVARFHGHLAKPTNAQMADWLRSAQSTSIGLLTYATERNADTLEIEWIARIRERWDLLNHDPGGHFRTAQGVVLPSGARYARFIAREVRRDRWRNFVPKPRHIETKSERWARLQSTPANLAAEISRRQMLPK